MDAPSLSDEFELDRETAKLLPSEEDVRFYERHGWFITPPIFSATEIERAIAGSERYYGGERDAALPDGSLVWGWKPEDGNVLRKNDYSSLQNRELAALVHKPILGAIAARLARVDEIRLWHDQLLYKPALSGSAQGKANVGWHTDRGYWKAASSTRMLTAWIPFHDVDATLGTMHVIDGSHRWPESNGLDFFNPNLTDLERNFATNGEPVVKVPMNLKRGQVSFHSCLTIHGSGPNLSDHPRRAIAVHLQDGENRFSKMRHPDGTLVGHANCRFVRRIDDAPDFADPLVCPVLWRERRESLEEFERAPDQNLVVRTSAIAG